jgi:hypothetical protein
LRDPLLGRLRRQQRCVTARAPLPLAVTHVPPRPAAGTHLDHATSLTRIKLNRAVIVSYRALKPVIHNFHRFIHSPWCGAMALCVQPCTRIFSAVDKPRGPRRRQSTAASKFSAKAIGRPGPEDFRCRRVAAMIAITTGTV